MAIPAYVTWNIDPEIFSIGERGIRWYGALLALGFYLSFLVLSKILAKDGFPEKKINTVSIYLIIGTILGLRLGHCFFYEPLYYLNNPGEILMVWKGGLASHGGAAGILLVIALFAWRNKLSYLAMLDRVVVIVPLAGAFVRLGNLMNSEIVGKTTDVAWAFYFPRYDCAPPYDCDVGMITPRHPSQLYEAFFYILLFVFMFVLFTRMKTRLKEGTLLGIFLILLFGFRFLIEFVKDVQVDFEQEMTIKMGQILSIPFILAGIVIVLASMKWGRRIDFTVFLKKGT
ncbi:MAG: prolipoprotein diacylglyceryl transferase [Bacteroidetes bacterium]|nr:prolipoprotein diacylglyceryl transferase [Bacteroidota bacterium]